MARQFYVGLLGYGDCARSDWVRFERLEIVPDAPQNFAHAAIICRRRSNRSPRR
jgi:hypothetical protein